MHSCLLRSVGIGSSGGFTEPISFRHPRSSTGIGLIGKLPGDVYEELQKSVDQKSAINPPNRASDAKHANAHYIFVKGEVFETDLDFDRICRMLDRP